MKKLTYEKLSEIFDYTFKTGESYTEEIRQQQNTDWLAALEKAGWTDDEWLNELERRMDLRKEEMTTEKIRVTDGHVYEIKVCTLTDKEIKTRFGNARVLGIRADAKSAKEAYAFMVRFEHGYTCLMSRSEFKLIDKGELTK